MVSVWTRRSRKPEDEETMDERVVTNKVPEASPPRRATANEFRERRNTATVVVFTLPSHLQSEDATGGV